MNEFIARNNGAKPERIIWYRGGASEGSIQAILKNELQGLCLPRQKSFTKIQISIKIW